MLAVEVVSATAAALIEWKDCQFRFLGLGAGTVGS